MREPCCAGTFNLTALYLGATRSRSTRSGPRRSVPPTTPAPPSLCSLSGIRQALPIAQHVRHFDQLASRGKACGWRLSPFYPETKVSVTERSRIGEVAQRSAARGTRTLMRPPRRRRGSRGGRIAQYRADAVRDALPGKASDGALETGIAESGAQCGIRGKFAPWRPRAPHRCRRETRSCHGRSARGRRCSPDWRSPVCGTSRPRKRRCQSSRCRSSSPAR